MREYVIAQEEIAVYTNIQDQYTTTTYVPTKEPDNNTPMPETEETPEALIPYMNVDFEVLLQFNPDLVGWIAIPDTIISYPVVQATDNVKYLTISFVGEYSKTGTPFADMGNNMQNLDSNTIIYGHNMGNGRSDMFNTLLSYKDYSFMLANRFIQFDTIYERHGFWKVFAVIELDANNTAFNYQQMQFQSNAEFMEWASMAMELSMHSTETYVTPQEKVLALSTCDRSKYGQNGRFIILAVQSDYGFTYG
jgi:sortase B